MKASKFSEAQIAFVLKQADYGMHLNLATRLSNKVGPAHMNVNNSDCEYLYVPNLMCHL